ncbi:MAG: hypothetical protein ABUL67_01145 [Haliangium ochraceum]
MRNRRGWRALAARGTAAFVAMVACGVTGGGLIETGGVMAAEGPSQSERAYRAGKAAGGDREARAHHQRGIDSARAVLATTADAPDALLWLAANLAGEALSHGRLFALRVIPEIESTLLRLERVHPLHDHAAGARALANLYWKAPAVISVGSSAKARRFFELALERAPAFPGNQAMAAAFFADQGDCARARALALAVSGRADLDALGADAPEWRQLARDTLQDCE